MLLNCFYDLAFYVSSLNESATFTSPQLRRDLSKHFKRRNRRSSLPPIRLDEHTSFRYGVLFFVMGKKHLPSRSLLPNTCASRLVLAILLLLLLSLFCIISQWQTISYTLRPIWDTPPRPFRPIVHYFAESVPMASLCSLHGWTLRETPRRVFDAIIFNNELDLLEIRWRELMHVVTGFVLVESNTTFTGQVKPLLFSLNVERFAFAESRVFYENVAGRKLKKGEDPFVLEELQRNAMNKFLEYVGVAEGDLVIMADVDEIPSAHTIDLLRWCDGIPDMLHLQMNSYIYSFEFMIDKGTWRPSVHIYKPGITTYNHDRRTDVILTDSGWHCSFCFRHVENIVFKMMAYSHADRVRTPSFLDYNRVQEIICKGTDLFDMLPEAYTFRELISKMGAVPRSNSAVGLPSFLLNNSVNYKFLLPGNCIRERSVDPFDTLPS